ncbi:MAG: TolC family protein [Acidobacteriota bacterium]|nr:MAG: TolC family protein [Acidobacteriota bacterium]
MGRFVPLQEIVFLFAISFLASTSAYPAADTLPDEVALETALRIAREGHPSLLVAERSVSGSRHLIDQGALRRNPSFSFQMENVRFTGDPSLDFSDDVDIFAYVTQPLERGGKRSGRVEVGKRRQQVLELRRVQTEWMIRQEVRVAFWKALLAQKELAMIRENTQLFGSVVEYHKSLFQEGVIPEADLVRIQLEQGRLELMEEAAAGDARTARLELTAAMGFETGDADFLLVDEPLSKVEGGGASLEEIRQLARVKRLEIQVARAEIEVIRAEVELEKANGRQDWDLILGYKRTGGFDTLLGGISIPLPLFDKNQGNIAFRISEVDRVEAMQRQRAVTVDAEVLAALSRVQRRYRTLVKLESGMLDQAEESWSIARAAYAEGAGDLLRLIDAQRSRNDILLLHNRAELELQIERVKLEASVGVENLQIGLELVKGEELKD